ncbi:hypothetical protein N4G62_04705 [Sphingomonas sanguinis]|uniref:Antitoxin Xre/MbcA/ParS-like toxin-binding domain-containing protein n=1 Tax=Sphingomonas sanguinis TaxID=33051 RepID=A0ABU5LN29_9SPHN|nr:hypothetical protein [Sphingomonas sanguinis]MDZ7281326.1 hypothetical protein [Sphingomonas sanguinis]
MSEQDQPQSTASSQPHTQRFRRAANAVTLTPDQRRRQASIMATAWKALASRDAVMQFFNAWSEPLSGRPLDLATDSEAGFVEVERALHEVMKERLASS